MTAGTLCLVLLAGCATNTSSRGKTDTLSRRHVEQYVSQIEALHRHRISNVVAAARMSALERQFAAFTVDIAAVQTANADLRTLQAAYAQTYIFEDSYLSAFVSGLVQRNLEHLPDTQAVQRAAIIRWRTGLTVLARRAQAPLPADLQQAGRGEIAPAPQGSS